MIVVPLQNHKNSIAEASRDYSQIFLQCILFMINVVATL